MEHFSDTKLYQHITPEDIDTILANTKTKVQNLLIQHKDLLEYHEKIYFERSFNRKYRIAVFYGMPKIHKPKKNGYFRTRPVMAKCGTFLEIASKFIDYHFQRLTKLFTTYLKDFFRLLHDLQILKLPTDCPISLFTTDAISMYTFIDTTHANEVLTTWFERKKNQIPERFPTALLLDLLKVVMSFNVFQFGDLCYLQKSGTAMGTAVAPIYSLLYFGTHKNDFLLPKYEENMIYFQCFIDDILVI